MANDNKKTAAARGKQSVSRARKSASLNASSQVVGQRTPVWRLCERAAHEGSGETHRRGPFRGCASRKEGEPRGLVVRVGSARQPLAYARELP